MIIDGRPPTRSWERTIGFFYADGRVESTHDPAQRVVEVLEPPAPTCRFDAFGNLPPERVVRSRMFERTPYRHRVHGEFWCYVEAGADLERLARGADAAFALGEFARGLRSAEGFVAAVRRSVWYTLGRDPFADAPIVERTILEHERAGSNVDEAARDVLRRLRPLLVGSEGRF